MKDLEKLLSKVLPKETPEVFNQVKGLEIHDLLPGQYLDHPEESIPEKWQHNAK